MLQVNSTGIVELPQKLLDKLLLLVNIFTVLYSIARAAPFYVGWSGSGGGGCSNASNAPYAQNDDIKIYNT